MRCLSNQGQSKDGQCTFLIGKGKQQKLTEHAKQICLHGSKIFIIVPGYLKGGLTKLVIFPSKLLV